MLQCHFILRISVWSQGLDLQIYLGDILGKLKTFQRRRREKWKVNHLKLVATSGKIKYSQCCCGILHSSFLLFLLVWWWMHFEMSVFSFVFIMLLVYINMLFLVVLHYMWPIMYQSLLLLQYSALWLMFLHCFVWLSHVFIMVLKL